jgi:hypothetical protein
MKEQTKKKGVGRPKPEIVHTLSMIKDKKKKKKSKGSHLIIN